ncbi:unnamed protein product [Pylaiella littoralis]
MVLGGKKGRQPVPDHADDGGDEYDAMEAGSQASRARLKKKGRPSNASRSSAGYAASEASDISAGPEKWRRVRRGAHVSYQPFDVEDYEEAASDEEGDIPTQFPPITETADDRKNWPKSCPFLHMKFSEMAIQDKRKFITTSYYFWHFLVWTMLFNMCAAIVTSLISPSPKEDQVFFAFLLAFIGFWWFFFGHFRLLYHAMRYRKSGLYFIYQLETTVLFFIALYEIFAAMGNMTQLLAPLAPGSAVPVRQNPAAGAILLGIAGALWFVVLMFCFYFIRKVHYFKNLPLSIERGIYHKEVVAAHPEPSKKLSTMITDLFRDKLDKPHPPTKCGMLQGKDLWLQGMITLDTLYVEYRADVHVFDHLVHERFHYQDVLAIKTTGNSNMMFQLVHPTKRHLEDLEMEFDFSDSRVRDTVYKAATKLWRRVGRNSDLLTRERAEKLKKMRKAGRAAEIDDENPDLVEAFNKARRMETRERLNDHMVTYKDWQKILDTVKIHVLTQGQNLVDTGDDFTSIFHVAQGKIEVNEILEMGGASFAGSTMGSTNGMGGKPVDAREQQSYAKALAKRQPGKGLTKADLEEKLESEPLEYEDPNSDGVAMTPMGQEDSGSSEEEDSDPDEKTSADSSDSDDSDFSSDMYSLALNDAGPEMVVLGTLRKDDIFGVVPFLLAKEGVAPKSGLTFTAKDPITVVFSIDTTVLKTDVLKPKKDITAAFHKYLAVILGERTEAAEDAMFTRKVHEKRLEAAREEEKMLEAKRQFEEEQGPGADKDQVKSTKAAIGATAKDQAVRNMFSFAASESILAEFTNTRYTYVDVEEKQEVRVKGTFYITDHYFAFVGKKIVDLSHLEINRQFRDVMRHDEVITIKRHTKSTKALVFTDIGQGRKMLEAKTEAVRDNLYVQCQARWKSEDEVSSREMRRVLRRKMTRLSLDHLDQAETITQKGIGAQMTDMTEREKKTLFAGSVPIGLNRNQVVIGELNFNDNLYLLCTGIVRVQRVKEHVSNVMDSGKAMDRVVFQEIHSGEIFGFDSFLTGAPAYSSIVVDSEKAVVRSCTKDQIVARLREDRKLAAKFYRIAAVSIASRLAEISPLDIYL